MVSVTIHQESFYQKEYIYIFSQFLTSLIKSNSSLSSCVVHSGKSIWNVLLSTGQVMYARQFADLTGETLTNVSLLEDHLNNLLCDLITLAMNKYSKVGMCVW